MSRTLAPYLRGVDLRERILDTADELLAHGGYTGLTMDKLSQRVGIAKGTIYLYFRSKEHVALSVIDRVFHRVLKKLSDLARGGEEPRARLEEMLVARVVLRHMSFAHYEGSLPSLVSALRPAIHEYRQKHRDEEARIFADVIAEECRSSSELGSLEPMPTARAMLWATDALLPSNLSAGELTAIAKLAAEARRVAELLTEGLGTRAQSRLARRGKKVARPSRRLAHALVLGGLLIGASSVATAQPAKRPMNVDDQFRLVVPGPPLISPDGHWVLYSHTTATLSENAKHTSYWLATTQAEVSPKEFLQDGSSSPQWARDSRSVYFFRKVAGGDEPELFQQRVDDGVALQLSHLGKDAKGTWQLSPDGKFFVVGRDEAKSSGPGAETDVVFMNEGSNGQTKDYWTNLWRYDLNAGTLTRTTHRDWSINSFDVSPDGRSAVVAARPDNDRNTKWKAELFIVDLATGAVRQVTKNMAPESNPHWSPDGNFIVFTAVRLDRWENGNGDLWRVDVETGATRDLTPQHTGRFGVPVFSPDSRSLFVQSGYGTTRFPVRIEVASGEVTRLIRTDGNVNVGSWSDDRRSFAYLYQDFTTTPDVYIGQVDASADRQQRVTDLNPWVKEEILLGSVERVTWASFDGKVVEGLLYLPPGDVSGQPPRPLIVHVPCGPGCAWLNGFSAKNHVYAGLGYVQLSPNIRGASNYDDSFMRGNQFDIGSGDYRDIMTGVDAMIARRIADPDSLAIDGWSYGGVLGGLALTKTTRFKAASLGAMVSDWLAEYGAGANYDMERWYIGGNPWTNPGGWRERSSLTHADRVRTPTLLHHGDNDDTDSPFHSMNYFVALREFGVPARLMRYPGESHDLQQPQHLRLRDIYDIAWLQRYVRGLRSAENPQ